VVVFMGKESEVGIHDGQRYEKTEETVGGEGRGQRRKRKSGMMVVNPRQLDTLFIRTFFDTLLPLHVRDDQ
jgi:hypothetical protein